MIGVILFSLFFVFLFLGLPVGFAIGVSSLAAVVHADYPLTVMSQRMFTAVDSFSLMAIPLFMLAGALMSHGGITKRIIDFALCFVGPIRGGLAMVVAITGIIMGGISGSGVADAAALDDAVSVCLGARLAVMGYLSRLDFTGLDLVLSNYRQVPMGLATDETPPPLLERMVGEGRLGFKSGKGFYGYSGVTSEEVLRHRDARLLAVLRSLETINARFPSPSLEPANGGAWQNGPSSQKGEDT